MNIARTMLLYTNTKIILNGIENDIGIEIIVKKWMNSLVTWGFREKLKDGNERMNERAINNIIPHSILIL